MKVRYIGPFEGGVEIAAGGRIWQAAPGVDVDVPDDVAAGLVTQTDIWEQSKPPAKPATKKGEQP